ncbi:SspB family protein [Nitrospirillum viridazoti]|uniref:Stringent starvation protein B n=1 Tax=Nitrospirillum amazonense TaxID=28077 RepID=A0A560HM90_9PROT|nr:ClpXP protease specificity-enhancing factor SspB [Nitrospirillum amazonense]TWB47041.1 hypothetical protein FBZ92_13942 [Nitrospirillum amazonense]
MSTDLLRYDRMVEAALRRVVRDALKEVQEHGLPGEHHFFISFRTQYPGVRMPEFLRAKYPDEITIVLQYQFYGLDVNDERVEVTLSFNGSHERLVVPMAAITTFADPSVNFALQFQPPDEEEGEDVVDETAEEEEAVPEGEDDDTPKQGGTVVALDAFRKK